MAKTVTPGAATVLALAVALTLVGSAAAGGSGGGSRCSRGHSWCSHKNKCCNARDYWSDHKNCGRCGNRCASGICYRGQCKRCTRGTVECGSKCCRWGETCTKSWGQWKCTRPKPCPPGCCTKCIPLGDLCSTGAYAKRCCGLAECLPDAATGKDTCQIVPPPVCVPYGQPCSVGGLACCDANAQCTGTPQPICNGCKPRWDSCLPNGQGPPCCTAGDVCRTNLAGELICQPPPAPA